MAAPQNRIVSADRGDPDLAVERKAALRSGDDRVEVHLDDFGQVFRESRHAADQVREGSDVSRWGTAVAREEHRRTQ